MAVSIYLYNDTLRRLLNKEVTYTTLKLMLLDATAAFSGGHTTLNQVAGSGHSKEVFGHGWPQGGVTLANVLVSLANTNDAKISADNVSVTASAGAIGPCNSGAIYDDTEVNDAPLVYLDFGGPANAGDGTAFRVVWPAGGIIPFDYPG